MKRRLFTFALAALTIGLLGSCSKINERIDGLDNRVYDLENEKIVSIEQQIATINQSIADLETIRTNIQNLKNEQEAQGQDITDLQAKDQALEGKINDLRTYVDTELSKYATTEWANATFATLEQLNTTNTELGALKETVGKLGEAFDGKLSDLKTELTKSINTAVSNLESRISALEARVSALEKMIQTVSIIPAYNNGSVKAEDGILTINCVITPKEAVESLKKENFTILTSESEVLTKSALYGTLTIAKDEDLVLDKTNGTATIKVDVSSVLPTEEDKALTVAVNVKNGISDFTTDFVPVYVAAASGPVLPDGALKGEFSVSATKKVHFSQGNLYWDGDSFELETNQYDVQSSWSTSHVSYFYWGKTASVAYDNTYSDGSADGSDVFFTNATTETAKSDFTVNGVTGKYRTLSKGEWLYLINKSGDENIRTGKYKYGVTVCGNANCLILAPDDFEGTIAESYDAAAWATAEAAGLVCLPAAGSRNKYGSISSSGVSGNYWSSSANGKDNAYYMVFDSGSVYPQMNSTRNYGYSVRLVTEVK